MILARRKFLTGLAAAFAAPAIVKASSLMPVKAMPSEEELMALLNARMNDVYKVMAEAMSQMIYGDQNITPVRFTGFEPRLSFPYQPLSLGFKVTK